MKTSLYFRNFVSMAVIVLLSFIILGSLFFTWSYRLTISERREDMQTASAEVVRSITAVGTIYELGSLDMSVWLSSLAKTSGFDILVADTSGTVISCSDATMESRFTCEHLGRTIPGDTLHGVLAGSADLSATQLGGVYPDTRYALGAPLVQTGTGLVYGFVFLSGATGKMLALWREFASVFMLIAVIVMFITFIISLIMTKKSAEPINEMACVARRFARGDFSIRATEAGREDEIGQLTAAFNFMADSLERSEALRREFIANVSHELKTPMTSIAGFADGILDGTIPPEREAKYLEIISSETRRLSRLVRSMLDMSQMQVKTLAELHGQSFDIAEVIRLSLLSLGAKIEEKALDVRAELPEAAIITLGDKDAITQVVYNLLDNAVKFSPEGGALSVILWKQGPRAFVSVENAGQTIPEDEMPNIFERFHKLDKARSESRNGIGLGLYIAKTILDNHNEDIYVTSEAGLTRFTFTLTIAEPKGRPDREK